MDKIKRIKELTEQLNQYRDSYYNDSKSLISDKQYDDLFDELQKLEIETGIVMSNSPIKTVGYEVKSKLKTVKHSHPMLSLDKTKSIDDLVKFSSVMTCMLSLKMDGLTVLLTYENGELVQAETRGNGDEGEVITHNAKVFDNIPLQIDYKEHLEVEGEAIITYDDFEKINSELPLNERYKNPRNLVSGSVRQLDSSIAAKRHIRFIAWKVPCGFEEETTVHHKLNNLCFYNFDIVPYILLNEYRNIEEDIDTLKSIAKEKSYPIDGLVCSYCDIEYGRSLGITSHHPKHSLAYKFYDEEILTTLKDIEWSIGKTGVLTPVAIFDEVEIEGTQVNRASLHNISIMKSLELKYNDTITVYKSNQIIPQVRDNLDRNAIDQNYIVPPSNCPICGGKTKIVKDNDSEVLICTNPDCTGKLLGQLSHFVSKNAINIDGLSEQTLQKFVDLGWVKSFIDIYRLNGHKTEMYKLEGFGKKSVDKLLENIEKSRNTDLARYIYALSIPLIGRSASKDIAKACGAEIQNFIMIMSLEEEPFIGLNGFGKEMCKSLKHWWVHNKYMLYELMEEFTFIKEETNENKIDLSGKVFVITGTLNHYKNRDELVNKIESLGGKVSGSVSTKTSYLVNNNAQSSSSKNKKAKSLNIPIISEEDFIKMIS